LIHPPTPTDLEEVSKFNHHQLTHASLKKLTRKNHLESGAYAEINKEQETQHHIQFTGERQKLLTKTILKKK